MIVENGREKWVVEAGKQTGEWLTVTAVRKISQGTRKIKSTTGKFVAVNTKRSKYNLGWNGERFSVSSELDAVEKNRPWLLDQMEIIAKTNWRK